MYKVLLFCITSFILVPIVTSAVLNTVPLTMDAWSLGVTVPRGAAPRYTLLTWTADKYYEEVISLYNEFSSKFRSLSNLFLVTERKITALSPINSLLVFLGG